MSSKFHPSASSGLQALQKRSALACLSCRTAKNKCDGTPPPIIAELSVYLETKILPAAGADVHLVSERACTPCPRLRLECLWQPPYRTGRPRKRVRATDAATCEPAGVVGKASGLSTCNAHLRQFSDIVHALAGRQCVTDASGLQCTEFSQATTEPADIVLIHTGKDFIAMYHPSQNDSSRAAMQPDIDHDLDLDLDRLGSQIAVHKQLVSFPLAASPCNLASPLLIANFDQIHAPTCQQPSFSPSADNDRDALLFLASDRTFPSSTHQSPQQARAQFSALRARSEAVPRSTSFLTTEPKACAYPARCEPSMSEMPFIAIWNVMTAASWWMRPM